MFELLVTDMEETSPDSSAVRLICCPDMDTKFALYFG